MRNGAAANQRGTVRPFLRIPSYPAALSPPRPAPLPWALRSPLASPPFCISHFSFCISHFPIPHSPLASWRYATIIDILQSPYFGAAYRILLRDLLTVCGLLQVVFGKLR
jgi:hypothetical protein